MPLESLLQLVETLRERISAHRVALSQSEALTRYALIDPLLRELGWDTEDPNMVVPEYRVPNNQIADYVLFNDGKPAIVVESKKLDESLRGGRALDQGILYCAHTQASYFLLTDGNRWELFDSGSTTPRTTFSLSDDPPTQSCLRALALWRQSAQSRQFANGESPVVGDKASTPSTSPLTGPPLQPAEENSQPTHSVTPAQQTEPPRVVAGVGWLEISVVGPKSGDKAPAEINFPNQTRVSIGNWKDILVEVVRWLIESNYLTTSHCPIPYSRRSYKRYVVSTTPSHQDGTPFSEPEREQIRQFYIDTKHAASQILTPTQSIIQHVGLDPADFRVRFA